MIKFISKILTVGLMFGFISCSNKEVVIPESSVGSPVFSFEGELNGTDINLEAGIDNYFMNSYYRLNQDTLFQFIGELKKVNCENNCQKISLIINDNEVNNEDDVNIEEALNHTTFDYLWNSLSYGFCCFTESGCNYFVDSHTWYIDGIEYGIGQYFDYEFPDNGEYDVMCVTRFANNYSDTSKVFVQTSIPYCLPLFEEYYLDFNYLDVGFYIPEDNIISINWDFGDGTTEVSTNQNISHHYSEYAEVKVCADIVTTDCQGQYCKYIKVGNNDCVTGICFGLLEGDNIYSKITLEYQDNEGNIYSSNSLIHQPIESYFNILSIEPYLNNLNDQKSYKLTANLQCKLYNKEDTEDTEDTITLTNALLTFAVAYP